MDEAATTSRPISPPTAKKLRVIPAVTFHPPWDHLCSELLCLIFVKIPLDERLRTVPFVCRAWKEAVNMPLMFQEIELFDFCRKGPRRRTVRGIVDDTIRNVAPRGREFVEHFSAYNASGAAFDDAMKWFRALTVLKIPKSGITDEMIIKYMPCLTNVVELDISCCSGVTYKAIEAIGNNCKSLVHLCRCIELKVMMDLHVDEEEALAIARSMPGLRHVELTFGLFSDYGLKAILDSCKDLGFLEIGGCVNVLLEEEDLEDRCFSIPGFKLPFCEEYEGEVFRY